ncbi:hypothetical protein DMC30DRAFT_266302 [Rhodotorula diobovata]|uniref:Uncharacterized protein n=1 Tax=Rhodotorula diobovata TaxID=5288 RepID=A0A5C5FTI3_9BASI|nr:hypothetical protein DMC30DRAFT_266302 [Rhodotorula diobovata]
MPVSCRASSAPSCPVERGACGRSSCPRTPTDGPSPCRFARASPFAFFLSLVSMPRRQCHEPVFDSDDSPTSSLYASPPSARRCSRSPVSPTRRPPRHTLITEPPHLHVRETLSAEAATRLMLEKWDLMDALSTGDAAADTDRRGRRRKGRPSSLPSQGQRRVSRVREYELWHPERERIRLAQVEMERRADEEAEAARVDVAQAEEEAQRAADDPVVKNKKVRDRKATPRLVVSAPVSDEDSEEDWRSTGRRSATTSMASTGSPRPRFDDSDSDEPSKATQRRGKRGVRGERDLGRPPAAVQPLRNDDGHARASPRLQPAEQSSSSRSSRRRPPPPSRAVSLPSSPRPSSSKHHDEPGRDVAPDIAPDSRLSRRQPSRSSRRRPRPSLAETPSRTPSPVRTPRSPGKSPSPSLDPAAAGKSAAPAAELLGAAADAGLAAVEQVGEAVSSALSRVGAFFGSGARTRQV